MDRLLQSPTGRFVIKRVEGPPHWLQSRRLLTLHGPTWGEDEIRAFTTDEARATWEGPEPPVEASTGPM